MGRELAMGKRSVVIDGDGGLPIQQGRRADGRCHSSRSWASTVGIGSGLVVASEQARGWMLL